MEEEKSQVIVLIKLIGAIIIALVLISIVAAAFYWMVIEEDPEPLPEGITAMQLIDDYNHSINGFESYGNGDSVYIRDILLREEYNVTFEPRMVLWFASTGTDYVYTDQTEIKCFEDTPPGCFDKVNKLLKVGEFAILEVKIVEYEVDGVSYEGLVVWDVVYVPNS